MEKEKNPVAAVGLFIMVGLMVLGICMVIAVGKFKSYDRVVSVKGLCEKEVPADKVIWPLAYKLVGNELMALYNEINRQNDIVIQFLTSNGLSKDDIYVSAPQIIDVQADMYVDQKRTYRYNVTSVITVATDNVAKVREIIDKQTDLLAKGVALTNNGYNYQVSYEFTGLNEIKPGMIEEATANARNAAEKFAENSKSRLGKIKNAWQGQFSVSDRDANTPYIKNVRVVTSVDYYLR